MGSRAEITITLNVRHVFEAAKELGLSPPVELEGHGFVLTKEACEEWNDSPVQTGGDGSWSYNASCAYMLVTQGCKRFVDDGPDCRWEIVPIYFG